MFSLQKQNKKAMMVAMNEDNEIIYFDREGEQNAVESDSVIQLLPAVMPKERTTMLITGKSGSGKSTTCVDFAKKYKRMYPQRKIYLFSGKPRGEDLSYDKMQDEGDLVRIELDERLMQPIELNEVEYSLCIFDDTEKITNKDYHKIIYDLIVKILNLGRSYHCSCIVINHLINAHNKYSRDILLEVDMIVFYKGEKYFNKYYLKTYEAMKPDQIEEIMNMDTRKFIIMKNHPSWILTDHKIFSI